MIFVTGDTHGDFHRFSTKRFPQQKTMSHDDYVIICGDFGGVWNDSNEERHNLDWLSDKPFTTLWVDGNHENYDLLNSFPVEQWHGGTVHRIRPNILHLMRGQVYDIDGLTFFTMGGASSHDIQDGILDPDDPFFESDYRTMLRKDKMFRILRRSWWPEELPSEEEYATALASLERVNWKVDYVISHCAPSGIVEQLGDWLQIDPLTEFFDEISKRLEFQCWIFGHYHENGLVGQNYALLYEQILAL